MMNHVPRGRSRMPNVFPTRMVFVGEDFNPRLLYVFCRDPRGADEDFHDLPAGAMAGIGGTLQEFLVERTGRKGWEYGGTSNPNRAVSPSWYHYDPVILYCH